MPYTLSSRRHRRVAPALTALALALAVAMPALA